MSVIGSNILAGASGQGGYFIDRSLRFRSSASAYLNRTYGTPTDGKKWTLSLWLKRGLIGASSYQIMSAGPSISDQFHISGDSLSLYLGGAYRLVTTQVLRDPSAWYHIVLVIDTANATADNRNIMYINGVQVTSFSTRSNLSLNATTNLNSASVVNHIGRYAASSAEYIDGYLTEVNFIDGKALTPTDFGDYNSITGVWQAKKYTGTYGNNGFYLNFSDNTSTTTLGEDGSGNGNDWTLNNFSLTSGSTYDSMTDVPTLTSETAGNYAVMNPLAKDGGTTLSEANLKISSVNYGNNTATMFLTSGKWYWEAQGDGYVGAVCGQEGQNWSTSLSATGSKSIGYYINGTVYWDGGNNGGGLSTYGTSDVIGVAVDMGAGTVAFYKNGSLEYTATFGSGTVPDLSAGVFPCYNNGSSSSSAKVVTFNFGQRPFAYTPPTGFKALNTYNLPDSTVKDGSKQFDAVLYTGDGATTRSITGLSFAPDFLWNKTRSNADDHRLVDIVRAGGTDLSSSVLYSNLTNAQDNSSGYITQTSSGFDLGVSATPLNMSGRTYVSWAWKANGSGVSNTDGSITSTVSANTTAGFSIVTYTGTGANATVGHGLGVAPSMMIVKVRSTTNNWATYHASLGNTKALLLDTTDAGLTSSLFWNNTSPTSSVFSVSTGNSVNNSGQTYVAYCFAEVEGFSKMGSYTGNFSTDGPFVYCGFKPAFILTKCISTGSLWGIWDTQRNTYNPVGNVLQADSSASEASPYNIDVLSNGFKFRDTNSNWNGSGQTFIFTAFAENPFKNSLAR